MLFTGADVLLSIPILRRVLVWWGLTSASAKEMTKSLKRAYPHNCLTLMPGGIAEVRLFQCRYQCGNLDANHDCTLRVITLSQMFCGVHADDARNFEQIILHKRTGFCRLALETGAALVPCYVMGANQVFTRYWGM
jgi:hypothetical protein